MAYDRTLDTKWLEEQAQEDEVNMSAALDDEARAKEIKKLFGGT